ncbi:MAG: hypothetical protein LKM38_00475 [Pseudomonas veronii]|jgi:hypothetical protein|nr:hypothetical protein [Pseudomonas veronii]
MIALFIGLVFAGLECGLRFEIKDIYVTDVPSWLDLTLLLGGYLFVFCLKPIQKTVQRKNVPARSSRRTPENYPLTADAWLSDRRYLQPCSSTYAWPCTVG